MYAVRFQYAVTPFVFSNNHECSVPEFVGSEKPQVVTEICRIRKDLLSADNALISCEIISVLLQDIPRFIEGFSLRSPCHVQ